MSGLRSIVGYYFLGRGLEDRERETVAAMEQTGVPRWEIKRQRNEIRDTVNTAIHYGRYIPNAGLALTAVTSIATGEMQYKMLAIGEGCRLACIALEQAGFMMSRNHVKHQQEFNESLRQLRAEIEKV